MAINKALFSSKKQDWETPDKFFQEMNEKYGPFRMDVCATEDNRKCEQWYDIKMDGLSRDWLGFKCWMNPPYNNWQVWVKKAYEESLKGSTVCCLLPARTDTKAFHEYCLPYGEITFIKGRLKFVGAKDSAPFPSMIVLFGGK